MGFFMKFGNTSLEDLLEAEKEIAEAISEKKKEIALSKSGFLKGNFYSDVENLKLVDNPHDIMFLKWFVKEKLHYTADLPKYIHRCDDKNVPEVTYIFDDCMNSMTMLAGKKLTITIHEDSIPYLMDEYKEWCWRQ